MFSTVLIALVAFVCSMMFLVFIHEYGHYKMGRIFGVKARKFSIGFGKPLHSWEDKNGCKWQIAPIPFGGYVAFVDGRNEELKKEEEPYAFDKKPLWQRSMIVLAGPMTNLIFALLAFTMLNLLGTQDMRPIMGPISANSIAQKGGWEDHMIVNAVNGETVSTFSEVNVKIAQAALSKTRLDFDVTKNNGENKKVYLDFAGFDVGANSRALIESMGFILPGNANVAHIDKVVENGAAWRSGMKDNSTVRMVNGEPVTYWADLRALLIKHNAHKEEVKIDLMDNERSITYTVLVKADADDLGVPRIGVTLKQDKSKEFLNKWYIEQNPNLFEAAQRSVTRAYDVSVMSLMAIKGMITGTDSVKGITGPVGIAEHAGKSLEIGLKPFLAFTAFISLSLFLMNMLPIPALDGGHLLQYAVEGIIRRPLPVRLQNALAMFGMAILLGLMLVAVFNDISRVFGFA